MHGEYYLNNMFITAIVACVLHVLAKREMYSEGRGGERRREGSEGERRKEGRGGEGRDGRTDGQREESLACFYAHEYLGCSGRGGGGGG